MLRVGILSFAHVHAASYARLLTEWPGIELLAADPDAAGDHPGEVRGRAFAEEVGVAYADSYEELFAWQPHAVIVTAENTHHRELVERAAEAGAHILCEKPLATSWDDAMAMVAACDRGGVTLMTAYPTGSRRRSKDCASWSPVGRWAPSSPRPAVTTASCQRSAPGSRIRFCPAAEHWWTISSTSLTCSTS